MPISLDPPRLSVSIPKACPGLFIGTSPSRYPISKHNLSKRVIRPYLLAEGCSMDPTPLPTNRSG